MSKNDRERFWLEEPRALFRNFYIVPQAGMTEDEKLNALTRLLVVGVAIMALTKQKYWFQTLLVGIIIIIAFKYVPQSKVREGFRDIEMALERYPSTVTNPLVTTTLSQHSPRGNTGCGDNDACSGLTAGNVPTDGLFGRENTPVPLKTGDPYFPQSDGFSSYVYGSNEVGFGPDDTLWAGRTAGVTGDGRDRFPYRSAAGRSHPCNPSPVIYERGTCSQTTLDGDSYSIAVNSNWDRGKYVQPGWTPGIGRSYWRMEGPQKFCTNDRGAGAPWKVRPPLQLDGWPNRKGTHTASPFIGRTEYGDHQNSIRGYPSLDGRPLNSISHPDGSVEGFPPPSEKECCGSDPQPPVYLNCRESRTLDWRKYRDPVTGINPQLRYSRDIRPGQNSGEFTMTPPDICASKPSSCYGTQYRPNETYMCRNPPSRITQQTSLSLLSGHAPQPIQQVSPDLRVARTRTQSQLNAEASQPSSQNRFGLPVRVTPPRSMTMPLGLVEGYTEDFSGTRKRHFYPPQDKNIGGGSDTNNNSYNMDVQKMNVPDAIIQGSTKLLYPAPGDRIAYYDVTPNLNHTGSALYDPGNAGGCTPLPGYKYITSSGSCVEPCRQPAVYPGDPNRCGDTKCPGNRYDPYVCQGYDTRNGVQTSYTMTPCLGSAEAYDETNNYYRPINDIRRTTNQGFETLQFQGDRELQNTMMSCNRCFQSPCRCEDPRNQTACHYITRNNISAIVPPDVGGNGGIGASSETALEAQDRYELMRRESLQGGYRNFLTSRRKHGCAGVASSLGFYYT